VVILNLVAVGILGVTEWMRRGSRVAACLLLAGFLYSKGVDRVTLREPLWQGTIWVLVLGGALANGVWGTFALSRARRDRTTISPPSEAGPA
jgi:hypothetical protein